VGKGHHRRQTISKEFKDAELRAGAATRPRPRTQEQPEEQPKPITITDALAAFIKDCEARNPSASTLRKYRLLRDRLSAFCAEVRASHLPELGAESIRRFRERRKLSPRTSSKELERIRAFFRFCQENGWTASNPAKAVKAPQVKTNPRLPFSEKEIQAIFSRAEDDRELAFLLTLRHTGLRIGDASLLRVGNLSENRLYLYTTKAGTPVSILLPDQLVSLLTKLPPNAGYFFLRGESTSMHTTADLWRRRIKILCKEAGILKGADHPHRFRHSLAADLLSKGAGVEDVAAILGNSPAVVQKHYSQWIKSRQDRLDSFLRETWAPKLVRVK
jgi:integrase/recombinase XerD